MAAFSSALMSRAERKYCLSSTSCLVELFDIFVLLHIGQNGMCFCDFLSMTRHFVMLIIRNLNPISVIYLRKLGLTACLTKCMLFAPSDPTAAS